MSAPDLIRMSWTEADDDTPPRVVSAHTVRSTQWAEQTHEYLWRDGPTMKEALAAAEARGRVQGVREAAGKAYEILNGHGQTLLGYECRAAVRSILTQEAAE